MATITLRKLIERWSSNRIRRARIRDKLSGRVKSVDQGNAVTSLHRGGPIWVPYAAASDFAPWLVIYDEGGTDYRIDNLEGEGGGLDVESVE